MLYSDRRVLSVSNQLPSGSGLAAQSFEYVKVVGTGTHNTRGWALHKRGNERECKLESRRGVEDSRVGCDPDEARKTED